MSRLSAFLAIVSLLILASSSVAMADPAGVPPTVRLDSYTGKPTQSFAVSGNGFAPGEAVDIYLGDRTAGPLATVSADAQGDITSHSLSIPSMSPGDYQMVLVGRTSQSPTSVGFNIQGFHPWAVLDNYYVAQQSEVGFRGEDFVPGEVVDVYLNTRMSDAVAHVTADANGHVAARDVSRPNIPGAYELIIVGHQSQTEVTATFSVAPPTTTNP